MTDHSKHTPTWTLIVWWVEANAVGALLGFGLSFTIVFGAKRIIPGLDEDRLIGIVLIPALALGLVVRDEVHGLVPDGDGTRDGAETRLDARRDRRPDRDEERDGEQRYSERPP